MDPLAHSRPEYAEKPHSREGLRPKLKAVIPAAQSEQANPALSSDSRARKGAILSFALGVLGLVSWVLPWVGFPLGFYGFLEGIRSRYLSEKTPRSAIAGIALCSLSMTLSVANLVFAAYLGSSGKNILSGVLLR